MHYDAKVTSKGQTTVPRQVREALGVGPGDTIRFVAVGDSVHLVPRNKPVDALFDILSRYAIPDTTTDDYRRAAEDAAAGTHPNPRTDAA